MSLTKAPSSRLAKFDRGKAAASLVQGQALVYIGADVHGEKPGHSGR